MKASRSYAAYAAVLVFVLLLNFWLPRLLPGGPMEYIAGGEDGAVFMSESHKQALQAYYRLDATLWEQFTSYVKGVFTLDFGMSFSTKTPVLEVILSRLPWTFLLVGVSTVLSILIGLALGLWSAWRHPGKADKGLFVGMLSLSAVPEFLIGMLLLLLLAMPGDWFPLSGAQTPFLRPSSWWQSVADIARHAALPVLTLTLGNLASLYLLMRNEAIRVRGEAYVEFAEAKGLSKFTIRMTYIGRSASLPIFTLVMLRIGSLLAGSVLAETVFAYPGVGKLLQEAILSRDYPLLHGLFFMMTCFVLCLNILTDLLYPRLDPRIHSAQQEVQ